MKTGNTDRHPTELRRVVTASMEPGHEDREYAPIAPAPTFATVPPQWSPVMKTGNTGLLLIPRPADHAASMEPGHEDREYQAAPDVVAIVGGLPQWSPVMKTGNTSARRWTRT